MQHGPLQTFHLNQHAGLALVRYSSKEEAAKAQKALTSCTLNNSTIMAEFIPESEVSRWAEQSQTAGSSGAASPGSTATPGSASSAWSSGNPPRSAPFNKTMEGNAWNGPNTNNVWGGSSSLWSMPLDERGGGGGALLPGGLLGGH